MNVLQELMDKIYKEQQLERERNNYNLGNLIEDLSKYPKDAKVYIEPFCLYPTDFGSYRGYYSDLSIEFTTESNGLNCGELLDKAKNCVGKSFYGYKGGDFEMTKNSVIWISNYGKVSNIILTGVKDRFGDGSYLELTWKIEEE